ncbi:MAG TPA: LysR family transcriptional regulator [Candidatus Polarisedimenticolaceae bacterium]|nr:LysR family transcriptional regulator [Candidatus Polarisedimenticolaceae bacterium]
MKDRPIVQPRFRLVHGGEVALGPGKADLLEAVARTGSLAQAAREMGMSYMRAWSLARTMNEAFRRPLVATRRGGQGRGGAVLTPTGERVLALYRKMQQRALRATAAEKAELAKLLRYR